MSPSDKQPRNDKADAHAKILADDPETMLYRAILQCKSIDECRAFVADLCTRQEIAALSERFVIARLLDAGNISYREISAATGASTTTVGRVARFLTMEPHHGYRLVLERLSHEPAHKKPAN